MLVLFGVGIVAGTLNVIAGGGSMLAVPALIWAGLPPTVANGTNRVAIVCQNVAAVWKFHDSGVLDRSWLRFALPPVIVGGLAGVYLATRVDDVVFQKALGIVMLIIAAYTLWDPIKHDISDVPPDVADHPLGKVGLAIAFMLVGFYAGFILVGTGFLILAVLMAGGMDLVRGNALKVLMVLIFMIPALGMFAWAGLVDWTLGFALGLGNFVGGLVGAKLTIAKGHRWVKRVVTAAVVVMAIKLLMDASA